MQQSKTFLPFALEEKYWSKWAATLDTVVLVSLHSCVHVSLSVYRPEYWFRAFVGSFLFLFYCITYNSPEAVCMCVSSLHWFHFHPFEVLSLPRAPFLVLLPTLSTLREVELMFDCGRLVDGKCSHSLCMTSMLLLISPSQPSRVNDFVHYVCLMKLSH